MAGQFLRRHNVVGIKSPYKGAQQRSHYKIVIDWLIDWLNFSNNRIDVIS